MKNQRGSAAVWIIVVLIIIIIAGAAYWYLNQNSSTQPATTATTEFQTQQAAYTSSQSTQTTQPTKQGATVSQIPQTKNPATSNVSVAMQTVTDANHTFTMQIPTSWTLVMPGNELFEYSDMADGPTSVGPYGTNLYTQILFSSTPVQGGDCSTMLEKTVADSETIDADFQQQNTEVSGAQTAVEANFTSGDGGLFHIMTIACAPNSLVSASAAIPVSATSPNTAAINTVKSAMSTLTVQQ